uniref:Ig-like domain-containing protein n=1 Tax=Canis lupus dingo TaxID=286419 RepID=A0A8C0JFX3_CANLU
MVWSPLLLTLLAHCTGSWAQSMMTQPPSVSGSLGQRVTIYCTGIPSNTDYRKAPSLLIYGDDTGNSEVPDQFSGSRSGSSASLTISGLQAEDEAEYYCSVWDDSLNAHTVLWVHGEVRHKPVVPTAKGFPLKHLTKYTSIPDQSSSERRDRGNIPQHLESHLRKAHSKYHSQWGNPRSLSPKVRNETEMTTLTTVIQHSTRSLSLSNQTTKRNKRHSNWQRRSQTLPLHR